MLDITQQGLLRYEERVRLERANGLRDLEQCVPQCEGCSPYDESFMQGMTYADLAKTPLIQNAVCPHTKVIVPVSPSFVVEEPVTVIKAQYPTMPYRVVDMNPCDGRVGVLNNIPRGTTSEIKHSTTVETHTSKVEDTLFDSPNTVRTVEFGLENNNAVVQPIAVDGTVPDNSTTADGKTKKKAPAPKSAKPVNEGYPE